MKKIRVWKVLLLSIVTLGIYNMVWLALRRNEIVKKHKLYIPHWMWLIAPILAFTALLLPLAFIAYGTGNSYEGSAMVFIGLMLIAGIVAFGIQVWWAWHFGKAVAKLTQGRVPLKWVIVYWFFLGEFMTVMLQYYFNRVPSKVSLTGKAKYKPSQRFVSLSILVALLSVAGWGVYGAWSAQDFSKYQQDNAAIDQKFEEMDNLTKAYQVCVDDLDKDYPPDVDLTDKRYAAYQKAYDDCETLRVKQNTAVDEYNKAAGL